MIVKQIKIWICQACLEAKGDQCHVPECALCRQGTLDFPISPELYEVLQEFNFEADEKLNK